MIALRHCSLALSLWFFYRARPAQASACRQATGVLVTGGKSRSHDRDAPVRAAGEIGSPFQQRPPECRTV